MPSQQSSVIEIVNPATEKVVGEVVNHTAEQCAAAVETSAAAQRAWIGLPGEARSQLLWKWGELVEAAHLEIAQLDVQCTGKNLPDAMMESHRGARHARYWAGRADKLFGQQLADVPGRLSYSIVEPLGVYVVVLPWNAPAHSFMARVTPALACGNSVIVKPSELSPLSAVRIAELAEEAGIPAGVLQVVTGDGATGAALCEHPRVAGVSFTGSVPTGRAIAHAAADTFKKLTLEMGGKSPIVVFDDADLDSAARAAVLGILVNAGQICAASSRLIVHADIADKFVEEVRVRMERVAVGDPTTKGTMVGPLVSRGQYEKVLAMLERAKADGARVLAGGGAHDPEGRGFYVRPTLLDGVRPDMEIACEEVFGPVLTVQTFTTEAEAVELANAGELGLSSYVWTRDMGRMIRMTQAIEAGVVHGNTPLVMDSALPFGGFKDSGLGNAYGEDAVAGCTRTKRVTLRVADAPLPSPWPGI
ncbi:aldehyde dehydrogenase family protein [Streptomyces longhuiensis]|uniref:aldehyde dehydrogenase family protein n=1 Tax=Streptomyces TaxID=1883 RepID=UPI001D0A7399|nr:aldehyde dehydrogenase family protein [Streptomyces longhuiensis]UDL97084.1 aldehyde dehydrogenase family protein [Streptomyces longhuiensis]